MIGELASLTAALCWAIAAILYKKSLETVDSISANLIRTIPAAIFAFVIALLLGEFWKISYIPSWSLIYLILGSLVGLGLGDGLYFLSLRYIGVGRAVPITGTYPLFTAAFSIIFLEEIPEILTIIGIVIIVVAIWLLSKNNPQNSVNVKDDKKGVILAIITAVTWSIGIILLNAALTEINYYLANAIRLPILVGFLAAAILYSGRGKMLVKASRKEWFMLGLAGTVALGVGGVAFLAGISIIGATNSAAISAVTPLFSTVFSFYIIKERITPRIVVGAILAPLGVIILILMG
ncbi:MAG: DMT family transporter [Candidatus Jordarchaeum sp.]|uniref:DMT family transporter n=1 Tax=Candidatus Jordarchaeum sp. TaxID=2823881 RepID=UPI00404B03EE